MEEGKLLGDFKLIKQVGQGSLGSLFLAEQRFTKRHYAIKLFPEELAEDKAFIQRFEEEIASLAHLEHPHIVKIHNVSYAEGYYFLTEDFIVDKRGESTNLWHYFCSHQKEFSEETIKSIALQLGNALDFAHAKGNQSAKKHVHRSLKWNNILVGAPTNSSQPFHLYISDFGLSKVVGTSRILTRTYKAMAEACGITSLLPSMRVGQDRYPLQTAEGQKIALLHQSFIQNFSFLAPEQKRIEAAVDEKADIYSYGVLLYTLLMGDYPEGVFPMPSHTMRDLSWNWDLIIERCLQSDPANRPSSIESLLAEASSSLSHFSKFGSSLCEKSMNEAVTCQSIIEAVKEEALHVEPALAATSLHQFELFPGSTTKEVSIGFNLDKSVKEYQPEKREARNILPIQTEMRLIPAEVYQIGSNQGCRDEMPRHQITLSSFACDIHPVTNEQFVRYLEAIGEEKDAHNHDIIRLRDSRIKKSAGRYSIEPGYSKHPVVGVTWYGAVAYSDWVGKRLPTEAEWEVACCGGLENPLYPTGDSIEKTQANFFSSDTTAVMSYPSNGYGLFDMAGNVYEWCHDWYDYNHYEIASQEPNSIKGPLQGVYRVLRGGCWKSVREDLRCSKRHRNNPGAANATYGFRCVADHLI